MSTAREPNGRYTHLTAHAGKDATGREWELCEHCLRFRPNGEGRWRSSHPRLVGDGGAVYEEEH